MSVRLSVCQSVPNEILGPVAAIDKPKKARDVEFQWPRHYSAGILISFSIFFLQKTVSAIE